MSLNVCIGNELAALGSLKRLPRLGNHGITARLQRNFGGREACTSAFGLLGKCSLKTSQQERNRAVVCLMHDDPPCNKAAAEFEDRNRSWQQLVALPLAVLLACGSPNVEALADTGKGVHRVGQFAASGFLFKDTVEVTAFSDPKVDGVTVYVSNMDYSAIDKIKKGFSDPAQSSVTCTQTGPIHILQPIAMGPEGEEVFSESRSFLFKSVHVRRIYDSENNALVYVAYSTRIVNPDDTGSRFKTSIASVSLYNQGVELVPPTP